MCFISYTKDISYLKIVEELYSMQRTPTYGKFINAINGFKRKSQNFDNEILKLHYQTVKHQIELYYDNIMTG